ncbi:MAG TPA: nascent polypeptide-associated complex protein [Candidatus Thermoplasmatota archaeon]|nr:nascent polypeptide-associated complex protein [Candidatus Thermoplasmatota archaeon]
MLPGMGGMDPRQMSMMMRKMGIEMRDIEGVTEVVVRTRDREYRFAKPTVSVMKAQGSETWQVQGKAQVVETGASASTASASTPAATSSSTSRAPPSKQEATIPVPAAPLVIPEEDVRMVMEQTGKDKATARKALESCDGDIAEAIVKLS